MSQWTIRPLRDRIVVKPAPDPEALYAGNGAAVILHTGYREKFRLGIVVAVGTGTLGKRGRVTPIGVEPGDRIAFPRFAGNDVTLDGEPFVVLKADQILGHIDAPPEGSAKRKAAKRA